MYTLQDDHRRKMYKKHRAKHRCTFCSKDAVIVKHYDGKDCFNIKYLSRCKKCLIDYMARKKQHIPLDKYY